MMLEDPGKTYIARIASFQARDISILDRVLKGKTLAHALFPCILPVAPEITRVLHTPQEFSVSFIPQQFFKETLMVLPLYGENGVKFTCSIDAAYPSTANVINLKFSETHLQQRIFTTQRLLSLVSELIPVFQVEDATIYDEGISNYRDRLRFYWGPDRRQYPLEIGWISYFGKELVEYLGRERFEQLKTYAIKEELHGGMLILLQDEPFDASNPEHREREAQAIDELGLQEFVKRKR